MLTTYTLCRYPSTPDRVTREGRQYVKREICARNVRAGDLFLFIDMTGAEGTTGTHGIGLVTDVESVPARIQGVSPRRAIVPPWRRRVLYVSGWEGTLRSWQEPTRPFELAHADRVTVYRAVSR